MAMQTKYFIKSNTRKYLKVRTNKSSTGKKYAWGSKDEVTYFNDREKARSVARRYGGVIVQN